MRSQLGFLGAFALSLALMAGCSDENGEGGSGGTAGTGGTAGSGGMAGTGGASGEGGAGGTGECLGLYVDDECAVSEGIGDGEEAVSGITGMAAFWKIKLPLILPSIGIISILTFVGNFNAFDLIYAAQGALAEFERRTGRGWLGNVAASGTEIIDEWRPLRGW